jgi:CDP-paratose 2-epimerase
MSVAIVTGSGGLIGSEAAAYFAGLGLHVVGVDNDMRRVFFGNDASTGWCVRRLQRDLDGRYSHRDLDIRDRDAVLKLFSSYGRQIALVVHAAAQPSHDWAARDPLTDFTVNAYGTAVLLEATRLHSPDAAFIFTSSNKVYGEHPNKLPLVEHRLRWEIEPDHRYASGIREDMPIDHTLHSIFGASKVAADVMVQEYGRYFGLRTATFRCGCLTGPNHAGAELHGFLAYLLKCAATGTPYTVYGYDAKQVRDNIHSADLVRAFHEFFLAPRSGEVYNLGGGRASNCSMREAIELCESLVGRPMEWSYSARHRKGDHVWWISDNGRFEEHYPAWRIRYSVPDILREMYAANAERWGVEARPLSLLPAAAATLSA